MARGSEDIRRSADRIQREIEQARKTLVESVDELQWRTSPKRIADEAKQQLSAEAQTPRGKAIIAGIGVLVLIFVVSRFRRH